MGVDEVVDTSDVDEREVDITDVGCSMHPSPQKDPCDDIPKLSPNIVHFDVGCNVKTLELPCAVDHAACSPPPRKRRRMMSHDNQQERSQGLFSPTPPSSGPPVSLGVLQNADSTRPLVVEPRIFFQAIRNKMNPSNCLSLFSSPPQHFDYPLLGQDRQTASPSLASKTPQSCWSSCSRSMTAGSLFSSPVRGFPTPPTTSQGGPPESSVPSFVLLTTKSTPSSPLTPLPGQARSPSPDELQLISSRYSASAFEPQAVTPTVQHAPSIDPGETSVRTVRYSLRRRDPRQLNPYAYDKLFYKQQMRFNPDAIIKFLSPTKSHSRREAYEEDTQAEYVPQSPNPDGDGHNIGSALQQQQRKALSAELGRVEPAPDEQDVDWLFESLRPLSSSDGSDDEIRKLAKQARRQRVRAEAEAKSVERRAEAEARKIQRKPGKSVRKRRKSFPIPLSSNESSPTQQCGAPHSFVRALSELSLSLSPVRPKQKEEQASQSSCSSTARLEPPQTPKLNFDYQEDGDHLRVHDLDEPLECDPFPAPASASKQALGAPTSDTDSCGMSSSGESVDRSSSSSTVKLTTKDRKRFRVLRRMMPAAMIARHLAQAKQPTSTARQQRPRSPASSDSEAIEVPLIPGLARVRRRASYCGIKIKGDPESTEEDVEGNDIDTAVGGISDGHSSVKVTRIRRSSPRLREMHNDVISLGSLSDDFLLVSDGSSASDDSQSEPGRKWTDPCTLGHATRVPAREKSLIDWMLTRGGGSGKKRRKPNRSRLSKQSGAPSKPRLEVVTGGARRHREKQQTLLSFLKPSTSGASSVNCRNRQRSAEPLASVEDAVGTRKRKKRTRHRTGTQGLLYNLPHDGVRITSKHSEPRIRRGPGSLVIEGDDDDFRQALDPGWKAEVERWNKPAPRQPVADFATPNLLQFQKATPIPTGPATFALDHRSLSVPPTHRCIVPDMNIHPLRSGVKFGVSTYLGKGMLHQLISIVSGQSEPTLPHPCNSRLLDMGPTTSVAELAGLFGPLCDQLTQTLREGDAMEPDRARDLEHVLRASCQLISWLGTQAKEEFDTLDTTINEYFNGLFPCLGGLRPNHSSLTIHWYLVELSTRLAASVKHRKGRFPWDNVNKFSTLLMQHMMPIDLQSAFATLHVAEGDMETTTLPCRAAELWTCLIHLLNACDSVSGMPVQGSPQPSFWRLVAEMFPESSPTGAEASEDMWRTMLSACALSQVSVHGLSTSVFRLAAAWDLVATALKKIVLRADPEKEQQLPPRALKKRDGYLSCIVSRCFLLWSQWRWRLDEAMPMFKGLQEIFRSRNFANLRNEKPTYVGFLEHGDLELLSKHDHRDSVFEIFLKMVVQAVYSLNALTVDARQKTTNIKKLLQLAVPISPVPFSKTAVPSKQEFSMLLNRLSAMAVAIHLDPTVSNIRFRIGQARRCIDFKEADHASRVACIYGMMYFTKIIRHHRLPLDEALGWLADIANALMDEHKDAEALRKEGKAELPNFTRQGTITLIQLMLGSVRKIIEMQSLDKSARNDYPDPALLDGPWVTRVFNPGTNLVTLSQTGLEIRMLVQSFLDARIKALPSAQPPPLAPISRNQESQEEYEKLYLELDDAELLAALGDESVKSVVTDLKAKEDALCKVLDKSITPAVYRLVCKTLGEHENMEEDRASIADGWIKCWVGCANVLIQNGNKDWSLYMKLGQQSWEKIIDPSWRRRVGLCFNLDLLCLDHTAYPKYQDEFIGVLLVSSMAFKLTIEHEYASVVFTLDRLQYPLLRGAPFQPVANAGNFNIGQAEYREKRVQLLEGILLNTAESVRAGLTVESETYVGFIASMLSTMRVIHEENASNENRDEYVDFCRSVFRALLSHRELAAHPRVSQLIDWGQAALRRDIDS